MRNLFPPSFPIPWPLCSRAPTCLVALPTRNNSRSWTRSTTNAGKDCAPTSHQTSHSMMPVYCKQNAWQADNATGTPSCVDITFSTYATRSLCSACLPCLCFPSLLYPSCAQFLHSICFLSSFFFVLGLDISILYLQFDGTNSGRPDLSSQAQLHDLQRSRGQARSPGSVCNCQSVTVPNCHSHSLHILYDNSSSNNTKMNIYPQRPVRRGRRNTKETREGTWVPRLGLAQ